MWPSTDPLGHAGLTVAAVFILDFVLSHIASFWSGGKRRAFALRQGYSRTETVGRWNIDYRLVIIGSLLPDLLDKSLGMWLLPEAFNPSGRLIGHTILFHSLLLGLCLLTMLTVRAARSPGLPVFFLASAGHLLMDRMWESPRTLFWPRYGPPFGGAEFDLSPGWIQWVQSGSGPALIDGTGALVLIIFAIRLYSKGSVLKWLKTGQG